MIKHGMSSSHHLLSYHKPKLSFLSFQSLVHPCTLRITVFLVSANKFINCLGSKSRLVLDAGIHQQGRYMRRGHLPIAHRFEVKDKAQSSRERLLVEPLLELFELFLKKILCS